MWSTTIRTMSDQIYSDERAIPTERAARHCWLRRVAQQSRRIAARHEAMAYVHGLDLLHAEIELDAAKQERSVIEGINRMARATGSWA